MDTDFLSYNKSIKEWYQSLDQRARVEVLHHLSEMLLLRGNIEEYATNLLQTNEGKHIVDLYACLLMVGGEAFFEWLEN